MTRRKAARRTASSDATNNFQSPGDAGSAESCVHSWTLPRKSCEGPTDNDDEVSSRPQFLAPANDAVGGELTPDRHDLQPLLMFSHQVTRW